MRVMIGVVLFCAGAAMLVYVVGQLSSDALAMLVGAVLALLASVPHRVAARHYAQLPEPPRVVEQHLHLYDGGVEAKWRTNNQYLEGNHE